MKSIDFIKLITSVILMAFTLNSAYITKAEQLIKHNEEKMQKEPFSSNYVHIPDEILLKTINKSLGKSYDLSPVTEEEMKELIKINPTEKGVQSLEGLEYAINLEQLDMNTHNITNLEPISNLTKLNKVFVSGNKIKDLSPLKNLGNLIYLRVGDNPLDNIETIFSLSTNMKDLDISGLNFVDGELLKRVAEYFTKVENLRVDTCNIESVEGIEKMTLLKELRIDRNLISDITPLTKLEKLEYLDIRYNQITNLESVEQFKSITTIRLQNQTYSAEHVQSGSTITVKNPYIGPEGGPMTNIVLSDNGVVNGKEFIWNLEKAGQITLTGTVNEQFTLNNNVYEYTSIFTQVANIVDDIYVHIPDEILLKTINKALGKEYDLSPVTKEEMKELIKINPTEKGVQSLEGLEYAINLEQLDMNTHNITSLEPISNLTKLNKVFVPGNKIKDLSPLKNLVNLRYLRVGDNPLDNIETIFSLSTSMKDLDISGLNFVDGELLKRVAEYFTKVEILRVDTCNIESVEGIEKMTLLKELKIGRNLISDITPLTKLEKLEYLDIRYNQITNLESVEQFKSITTIRLQNQTYSAKRMHSGPNVTVENPYIGPDGSKMTNITLSDNGVIRGEFFVWNIDKAGTVTLTGNVNESFVVGGVNCDYTSTFTQVVDIADVIDITVPTNISIKLTSQGEVEVLTPLIVTNNGVSDVNISSVDVSSKNGWSIQSFEKDFSADKVGLKEMAYRICGKEIPKSGGEISFDNLVIPAHKLLNLNLEVKIPFQVEPQSSLDIADILITVK